MTSATSARDAAQSRVDDIAGEEPDNPLANGKPNPRYPGWARQLALARQALTSAQAAVNAATAAVGQAVQQRDAAAGAAASAAAGVGAAQNQLAARLASVDAAGTAVTAAQAAESLAQQQIEAAQAAVTALDIRAARLLAEPLDRADLEAAADAEYAELADRRADRYSLMSNRATRSGDRGALLATNDVAVAGLIPARDAIAGWADAGRFGTLASARASIDGILAAAQVQQGRPATERTDDLGSAQTALAQAVAFVQAAINQATAERNQAQNTLTSAANALAEHQSEQP